MILGEFAQLLKLRLVELAVIELRSEEAGGRSHHLQGVEGGGSAARPMGGLGHLAVQYHEVLDRLRRGKVQ